MFTAALTAWRRTSCLQAACLGWQAAQCSGVSSQRALGWQAAMCMSPMRGQLPCHYAHQCTGYHLTSYQQYYTTSQYLQVLYIVTASTVALKAATVEFVADKVLCRSVARALPLSFCHLCTLQNWELACPHCTTGRIASINSWKDCKNWQTCIFFLYLALN